MHQSSNETIAAALRHLADTIQSPDDAPAACLREAAERIETLAAQLSESEETLTIAYMSGRHDAKTMIRALKAKNKRLREGLEWYRGECARLAGVPRQIGDSIALRCRQCPTGRILNQQENKGDVDNE
jgi:hypothetical protein